MICTNSTENALAQDITGKDYARMDQLDSFSTQFYGNTMCLIMLRQKGTTMVSKLPSGVFRRILEYQAPKVMCWRYSDPFELSEEEDNLEDQFDELLYALKVSE